MPDNARKAAEMAVLTVGEMIGSPFYIEAIAQEVIGVFSEAAKHGPLNGFRGDADQLAMTEERWATLRAELNRTLEKGISVAINAYADRLQESATRPAADPDGQSEVVLRDALKPFASFADGLPYFSGPSQPGWYSYESGRVGERKLEPADFERAKAALTSPARARGEG